MIMPNKSHFNSGHKAINYQRKKGLKHSSHIYHESPKQTYHGLFIEDSVKYLKRFPDNSIQLILIDPPYNLDLELWDNYQNYLEWAKNWIDELYRILKAEGNCIIFGGFQYQDLKKGDLLEILYYTRHKTKLRFTNLIIWYYKNGMSAHRFFANRHEELIWLTKSNKYYFDLDSVRVPYDHESKIAALKDKRLNPKSVEKGKNPTNVWEISRLNGNSKERVGHSTQKPLEIIRRLIHSLSYPGSLVLDFFAGSGTTGIVCLEESRNCILVDNDPDLLKYYDKHLSKISLPNLFVKNNIFKNSITIEEFFEKLDNQNGINI